MSNNDITGFYWRDFTGVIPTDAIPAGNDINGCFVYVGQAFIKDQGLIVIQINPNKSTFWAPQKSVIEVQMRAVKILCGNKSAMKWMDVTSENLHVKTINLRPVIGGFEDNHYLNIGRISINGNTLIGKIVSRNADNALMYYVIDPINEKNSSSVKAYQVLLRQGPNS